MNTSTIWRHTQDGPCQHEEKVEGEFQKGCCVVRPHPLTCVMSANGSSSWTSIWDNCRPCSGLMRITFLSRKIQSGVYPTYTHMDTVNMDLFRVQYFSFLF